MRFRRAGMCRVSGHMSVRHWSGPVNASSEAADDRPKDDVVADGTEMGPIDYLLVEWPGPQPNGTKYAESR
jgi:hypothetical protein